MAVTSKILSYLSTCLSLCHTLIIPSVLHLIMQLGLL